MRRPQNNSNRDGVAFCRGLALLMLWLTGCQTAGMARVQTLREQFVRDNLIVHADFDLPRKHRLIDEILARGQDIAATLDLPLSDEPIHVYLFSDEHRYQSFIRTNHPEFDSRRAMFVKSDTRLAIYCLWGDRVAEDLRHEFTHAILHGTGCLLPLWLDEGIAEYFETPRSENGLNSPHVQLLAREFKSGNWTPNLDQLQKLKDPHAMTQTQYAESWLWVHFLIHSNVENHALLKEIVAQILNTSKPDIAARAIHDNITNPDIEVVKHLQQLANRHGAL